MADKYADDIALIDATVSGDRAAWARLVETHSVTMRYAILRALRRYHVDANDDVLDDLQGDLMVSLVSEDFRRLRKYSAMCSLRQWLKVVAGNFTVDHLRKKRPQCSLDGLITQQTEGAPVRIELIDQSPSPEDLVVAKERRQAVANLLEQLNDEDRLFVELYYARSLAFEQVAEMMGTTLGAVYARKNRIRKRLTELAREAAIL